MSYTEQVLEEVRSSIEVPLPVIEAVRERRNLVRDAAATFPGAKRTFPSGSATHWTAIARILKTEQGVDGDCGVVLDRRGQWSLLGPDGECLGPTDVVTEVQGWIGPIIREEYPQAKVWTTTKRAIVARFGQPLDDYPDDDPTVDLIVALDRVGAAGLWIPNLYAGSWDASHPEQHNELLNAEPKSLRIKRARVVRLAKGWSRSNGRPVSGFNIEALALEAVTPYQTLSRALLAFFDLGATSLAEGLTQDPANVSGSIKLPEGKNREDVVRKFERARDAVQEALDNDDDEGAVREALDGVLPNVVSMEEAKSRMAHALGNGNAGVTVTRTGILTAGAGGAGFKTTRSYGDAR